VWRIAVVRDDEDLPACECEGAAILELHRDFSVEHMKYMAAFAPMIGEISRLIFDNAHTQARLFVGPGETTARLAEFDLGVEIGEPRKP